MARKGTTLRESLRLLAGLPTSVGGVTLNRFCSSGLQSIAFAANQIVSGGSEVMIAGGVESISMTPRNNDPNPRLLEHMPGVYMVMGETAEVVAKRYKISRQVQDEYALLSQQRTAGAQREVFSRKKFLPCAWFAQRWIRRRTKSLRKKRSVPITMNAIVLTRR